jgi:hypothetical protein
MASVSPGPRADRFTSVLCFTEQVAELESMVNSLQHQLLVSEKEASTRRVQLQESIANYETQTQELNQALQEARAKEEELKATIANGSSATTSDQAPPEDMEDVSLSHGDGQRTTPTQGAKMATGKNICLWIVSHLLVSALLVFSQFFRARGANGSER